MPSQRSPDRPRGSLKRKEDVTVDFDHHRSVIDAPPETVYAELRRDCPVAWTEHHGGYWVISTYEDLRRAFTNWRVFMQRGGPAIPSYPHVGVPTDLDPPEHMPYRRLLNPLLSRAVVHAELRPRIEYWATHFIDKVIEQGECDLVYDLALPIPGAVTLEWAGWENREEWPRISEAWHNLTSYPPGDERRERALGSVAWFESRIAEELEEHRRRPRSATTVLSYAARMEIDGKPVPEERAVSFVEMAIAAGVDTTTSLISAALVHLDNDHDHRQRLVDQPELWENATDEFLRRFPPVRAVARTLGADTTVGGCTMKAGERVLLANGSGCHDEAVVADPLDVVLDRTPNKHLAFGLGMHRCVGMHLAREEFMVTTRAILERMSDYQLDISKLVPYPDQGLISGWISLPATFSPGSRRAPSAAIAVG